MMIDKEKPAEAGLDDGRDSAYEPAMTIEELTPESVALLKSLVNNPHAIEDSPMLQLMMADRLVMGSPQRVHITGHGGRLLAAAAMREPLI